MPKEANNPQHNFKKKKPVPVEMLLEFYDATLRHETEDAIAAKLGITRNALDYRIEHSPELQYARRLAKSKQESSSTLANYIYKHLSPEAREIWSQVQFWNDTESAYDRIEAILKGKSTKLRQEIFVHALVCHSFDVSTACHVSMVSRAMLATWQQDFEFRQLIEEIQFHKQNFFEKALVELAESGNPTAIVFANKTLNAKRGYSEKLVLEHTGSIQTGIDIDKLDLPIEVKRQLLIAIKASEAKQLKDAPESPTDFESLALVKAL